MNDTLQTPVLFMVFNRLDTSQRVFEAIRQARPPRLYIAADGPRADRLGEAQKVSHVRDYLTSHVDWDCEVKTLFRDQNLGCRVAVSQAIDWFFEQEPEGIILEDDCLPDASFFPYAEALLRHYRDDERIMVIANSTYGYDHQLPHSYFFSRYNHCWGWASWRRAWQHFDLHMQQWPALRKTDWLLRIGDGDRGFERHWKNLFDQTYIGNINSWDYQWTFSCWLHNGLSILPAQHLVGNIGFGADSTHTQDHDVLLEKMPYQSMTFPLSHPPSVVRDAVADRWIDQYEFNINFYQDLRLRLREIIRGSPVI